MFVVVRCALGVFCGLLCVDVYGLFGVLLVVMCFFLVFLFFPFFLFIIFCVCALCVVRCALFVTRCLVVCCASFFLSIARCQTSGVCCMLIAVCRYVCFWVLPRCLLRFVVRCVPFVV